MDHHVQRVPALRVRALPKSTNAYGRVQAGWLLEQIDLAGSLEAERLSRGPVATVAVNAFQFNAPILLGDVVNLYVDRLRVGQKSVTLKIEVESERMEGECVRITEVIVTFVAIDAEGRSRFLEDKNQ
ncbi:acyl-CoA thioesterase [Gulbenkiania mobilis]|uniref:acyl-CoA thioesterase n=1 Tax=Gulbenkiania mobilis TaxID=397457 RepID=UPI0006BBBAA3|nr:acyl-CoA thioesterase [Gulbenkiania mobilis]